MNILLAAEESIGVQVLSLLAEMHFSVVGVLTQAESTDGRSNIAAVAKQHGYEVLPSDLVTDTSFASWVENRAVDVLLNAHSLHIIQPAIVDAVRLGAFNLHPGPLPEYAGLNAPSWAIVNGETTHGVTLHWMDSGIDSGEIAYQVRFPIDESDTGLSLSLKCQQEGRLLVQQLFRDLSAGPAQVPRIAQKSVGRRLYTRKQIPWGGTIRWDQSAETIHAFVRASYFHPFASPWGHPEATLGSRKLGVIKTSRTHEHCHCQPGVIGDLRGRSVAVATADEWLLVDLCQIDGRVLSGSKIAVTASSAPDSVGSPN